MRRRETSRAAESEQMLPDSQPNVSVIQLSWAGIFEKGLSLKTSKQDWCPKGTVITSPGLLTQHSCGRVALLGAQCCPGPLPPAKLGTFPRAHPWHCWPVPLPFHPRPPLPLPQSLAPSPSRVSRGAKVLVSGDGKFAFPCLGRASLCSSSPQAAPFQPGLTSQSAGGQAHIQRVPVGRPVWEGQHQGQQHGQQHGDQEPEALSSFSLGAQPPGVCPLACASRCLTPPGYCLLVPQIICLYSLTSELPISLSGSLTWPLTPGIPQGNGAWGAI